MRNFFATAFLLALINVLFAGCASGGGNGATSAGDGGAIDLASRFPSGVTVVEFYSTDCESCRVQDKYTPEVLPDLKQLGVPLVKIHPNTATLKKYRLDRYPTFVVLRDGQETRRFTGVTYREDLLPAVRSARGS